MNDRLCILIDIASKVTDEHLAQIVTYAADRLASEEKAATDHEPVEGANAGQSDQPKNAAENTDKTPAEPCSCSSKSDKTEQEHHGLMPCPHCGSSSVNRFGSKRGKPRFRCKVCNKTFVTTTNTIMYYSHQDAKSWETAANDTVNGVPLRKTAENLKVSEYTSFRMRHKMLMALEQRENSGVVLQGECELDETYVLESHKGKKIPGYWRGPRKHGAVAQKPGLSNEQVCIMTGIERGGPAYANTQNTATPSRNEIISAFHEHIAKGSHIICDGASGYDVLYNVLNCDVTHTHTHGINKVNGFHSFIKRRYDHGYHGLATKYLNRYNSLFGLVYGRVQQAAESMRKLIGNNQGNGNFFKVSALKTENLLTV